MLKHACNARKRPQTWSKVKVCGRYVALQQGVWKILHTALGLGLALIQYYTTSWVCTKMQPDAADSTAYCDCKFLEKNTNLQPFFQDTNLQPASLLQSSIDSINDLVHYTIAGPYTGRNPGAVEFVGAVQSPVEIWNYTIYQTFEMCDPSSKGAHIWWLPHIVFKKKGPPGVPK